MLPAIGVQIGSSGSPGQPREIVADRTQCTAAARRRHEEVAHGWKELFRKGPTISVETSSVSMRNSSL